MSADLNVCTGPRFETPLPPTSCIQQRLELRPAAGVALLAPCSGGALSQRRPCSCAPLPEGDSSDPVTPLLLILTGSGRNLPPSPHQAQWADLPLPSPPVVSTILVTVEMPAGVPTEWPAGSRVALHELVEGSGSRGCRSYNAGRWNSVPRAAGTHASIVWQSCSQVLSMKQQNSSSCLLSWSTALEHPHGQPSM